MSAPQPQQILQLYRAILRAAKQYPSVKRDSVVQEIKHAFHANKGLSDQEAVKKEVQVALRSLEQLEAYVGWDSKRADWAVSLKGSCN